MSQPPWQPPQYDQLLHQQRLQGGQAYGQQPPQWAGQPHGQQYPTQSYSQFPQQPPAVQVPSPKPRRKRRVFMWVFFAIQALFIIWIIAGAASKTPGPSTATQAAQQCANGGWSPLFKSYADCTQHYAVALNDATNAGKGIGVALIVVMWVVVDFFLGLGYGIYKLASRR